MREQEFRSRDKKVHKMGRDGLIEQNQTTGEEQRISQRLADVSFEKGRPQEQAAGHRAAKRVGRPNPQGQQTPAQTLREADPMEGLEAPEVWGPSGAPASMRDAGDKPVVKKRPQTKAEPEEPIPRKPPPRDSRRNQEKPEKQSASRRTGESGRLKFAAGEKPQEERGKPAQKRLRFEDAVPPPVEDTAPDAGADAPDSPGDAAQDRPHRQYEKAKRRVEQSGRKLEKAQGKLPTRRKIQLSRQYDSGTGRVRRRLQFEQEVIPEQEKPSLPRRAAKGAVQTAKMEAIFKAHMKIQEVEQQNVAVEAAHKGEFLAEEKPCTYVCEVCNSQDSENAGQTPDGGQEHCSCITLCTEGNINPDCPVCAAENADLTACKGTPAQPEKTCTCDILCTEGAVNADCPICGVEGADLTTCKGQPTEPEDEAVTAVQEQINALPTVEELQAMTPEEQQEVYEKLQAAHEAYAALIDEQKKQITGAEIFESLFEVFNSMTALAAEDAGFTITNNTSNEGTYTYENGVLTVQHEADLTISTSGQTSHRIVVTQNSSATITLNNVSITGADYDGPDSTPAASAIDLNSGATLALILADNSTNSLAGGSGETGDGAPGIHVPKDSNLAIQGDGSLSVKGGTSTTSYGGAGIGGNAGENGTGGRGPGEDCGTVVIFGKSVEVKGGAYGAGSTADDIGGGHSYSQHGSDGQGIRPTGDGNYVVWGEPILPDPPNNYTIPEGATLTVPSNAALCIPTGVTLTNHGTITGEGNLNGDGTLDGNGVVTVGTSNFQKDSALTLTIEGAVQAAQTNMYAVAYGSQITLKAEIKQADIRSLSAGDYNTVTFCVGESEKVKADNNGNVTITKPVVTAAIDKAKADAAGGYPGR